MHIAVVGTGIVGACSAAWLQRDGHQITFVDPLEPGQACSFGNAGSLSPSACLPVGMPNMWRKVPSWLLDPLGPLTIRTSYLPRVLPWLVRMLRHSTPKEVTRIAGSLVTLLRPERIGVELSEELQLHPEQSTDAIVVHHQEAKYFNAR